MAIVLQTKVVLDVGDANQTQTWGACLARRAADYAGCCCCCGQASGPTPATRRPCRPRAVEATSGEATGDPLAHRCQIPGNALLGGSAAMQPAMLRAWLLAAAVCSSLPGRARCSTAAATAQPTQHTVGEWHDDGRDTGRWDNVGGVSGGANACLANAVNTACVDAIGLSLHRSCRLINCKYQGMGFHGQPVRSSSDAEMPTDVDAMYVTTQLRTAAPRVAHSRATPRPGLQMGARGAGAMPAHAPGPCRTPHAARRAPGKQRGTPLDRF